MNSLSQLKFFSGVLAALVFAGFQSCVKEDRLDYMDADAPAPIQVSGIQVIPEAGGAMITYTLPKDPNLSYVKAVYEIRPNVFREAKSSIYTDTVKLVGFGDTLQHEVKLYSVGRNEKASEPLIVTVSPHTPPIKSIFKSLSMYETFGGVRVEFENEHKADVAIMLMVDTTGQNTWAPATTYYTSALKGAFSARGYDTLQRRFAVVVRDRWNNKSDTLLKSLTPIFETRIPTNTWSVLVLPTDQTEIAENYLLTNLWDGDGTTANLGRLYASSNASKLPQWFTIDFGKKVLMSRFNEHMERYNHLYTASALKKFEIWGSNNPDPDGGWNNWQLLGTFESFKPSGLPLGQVTDEDINYGNVNGEEFEFETPPPAVRYIRFKTLETYASSGQVVIQELRIFGKVED